MSANIILDRSNKALQATVVALGKAVADLNTLATQSEGISLQIEDKNAELEAIQAANDTAFREGAAELRLRVKEDRDTVLNDLMKEVGLARITGEALSTIQSDLAKALAKDDSDLKAAVAAAVASANRDAKAAALQVDAAYRVESASKDATNTALNGKVEFLTSQVADLRKQIEDERNTRLAIAQADAGRQGVVVNAGK